MSDHLTSPLALNSPPWDLLPGSASRTQFQSPGFSQTWLCTGPSQGLCTWMFSLCLECSFPRYLQASFPQLLQVFIQMAPCQWGLPLPPNSKWHPLPYTTGPLCSLILLHSTYHQVTLHFIYCLILSPLTRECILYEVREFFPILFSASSMGHRTVPSTQWVLNKYSLNKELKSQGNQSIQNKNKANVLK